MLIAALAAACAARSDAPENASEDDVEALRVNPADPHDGETLIADGKLFRYGDPLDGDSALTVRARASIDIDQRLAETVGVDLPPEGDELGLFGIGLRATGKVETYVDLHDRPRARFVSLSELLVCPAPGATVDCATFPANDRHGPVCASQNRAWLGKCEHVTVR